MSTTIIKDYKKIPAFVINLKSRPDRLERVLERFDNINLSINIWEASVLKKTEKFFDNFGIGAAGATDSHRRLWQFIVNNEIDYALIFEDDVVFSQDFQVVYPKASSELPSDWDIWHFHNSHVEISYVNKYIPRFISSGWGAHAYLIKNKTCKFLLTLEKSLTDTMLTYEIYSAGGAVYGMSDKYMLCFQEGLDSDISVTKQLLFWQNQRNKFWR